MPTPTSRERVQGKGKDKWREARGPWAPLAVDSNTTRCPPPPPAILTRMHVALRAGFGRSKSAKSVGVSARLGSTESTASRNLQGRLKVLA